MGESRAYNHVPRKYTRAQLSLSLSLPEGTQQPQIFHPCYSESRASSPVQHEQTALFLEVSRLRPTILSSSCWTATTQLTMRAVLLQNNLRHYNPTFSCCRKSSYQFRQKPLQGYDITVNRRVGALAALSLVLLAKDSISTKLAYGFDFQLVAPDQTIEEAESGIIGHAQALLQVKHLIESESWGQLQTAVRKGSPLLKQDIYTIIQQKPGNERPLLRKLYSNLFNYVTRLDYAARDRDASRIRECYENMVLVLNEVISRL